eukprot:908320-Alexandrium_andersonii.AAC.1
MTVACRCGTDGVGIISMLAYFPIVVEQIVVCCVPLVFPEGLLTVGVPPSVAFGLHSGSTDDGFAVELFKDVCDK